ncbi:MAG: TraR/DksA C4-type zinc finger protein [Candidatus Beckwithbacteria bacterium]|nr:TraR/DksA C4-type zinc finger protein [Candidatus Beckwithbacteria bacterium]
MSRIKFPLPVLKPVSNYLKTEEKKLKQRKKELEKEDPFTNHDRVNDNAAIDAEAAEESGHDRVSALKLEVDRMLVRIRKTLTRIKLGKFGLCEKCGKMIDTDRLAIDPTATECIVCANKKKD